MEDITLITVFVVALALIFGFTNGFNDSANLVASMISTRAINPGHAFWLVSLVEFIGAAFLGTAIAQTIAGGIVDPALIADRQDVWLIIAALAGAITWNIISCSIALPSSSGHALIGGMIGAFLAGEGIRVLLWKNLLVIGLIMIGAPLVSFLISFVIMSVIYFAGRWLTHRAGILFKHLQVVSSISLALMHGTNDAQKSMGMITLSLIALGYIKPADDVIRIPLWVINSCAAVIAVGVGTGAKRIIHTVGGNIYKMRPENGFCAQISSALVIYGAAICGCVISTAESISSAIAGAGTAYRIKKVKWDTMGDIMIAWIITMPAAAGVAALCVLIFRMAGLI